MPRKWVNLNVEPPVRRTADQLAAMLSRELGVTVSRSDAVRIAIDEAIEKREPDKPGQPRTVRR